MIGSVVSYSISTSNHNLVYFDKQGQKVVSYSISTSNHNIITTLGISRGVVSYSISTSNHNSSKLILTLSTVVSYSISTSNHNAPQLSDRCRFVVSYSISTSNHNADWDLINYPELYLIPFLHQTTTASGCHNKRVSCILFHFYIKPQRSVILITPECVVSYSISTSNHNQRRTTRKLSLLYLIPFLHQTTTSLIAIPFRTCCILFHFYIKPQLYLSP